MPASLAASENVDQESVTSLPRDCSGFDSRASGGERYGGAEAVAACEAFEDLRTGGAEVALTGRVLGERRRRKRRRLVGKPGRAVDEFRALVWAAPGAHHLAAEECANCRDGTNRVERTLVVSRATAGVGDCVREREEEPHIPLEAVLVVSVVVAA